MAARYARADAAKVLLDAGADCNAEDITGRTPLHAAIAADALGVFQVSHDESDGICFTVHMFVLKHQILLMFIGSHKYNLPLCRFY